MRYYLYMVFFVLGVTWILLAFLLIIRLNSDVLDRRELNRRAQHDAKFRKRLQIDERRVAYEHVRIAVALAVGIIFATVLILRYEWLGAAVAFAAILVALLFSQLVSEGWWHGVILRHADAFLGFMKYFAWAGRDGGSGGRKLASREELIDLVNSAPAGVLRANEKTQIVAAAKFAKKTVADIMIASDKIPVVHETDVLGPKLLDELHAQNRTVFPVMNDETIVGVFYVADALPLSQENHTIRDKMRTNIAVVAPQDPIAKVVAEIRSGTETMCVVMSGESFVGVVDCETVFVALGL